MAKLTEKQRRFVQHYTGNATEAAKLAGYSEKSAYSVGQENLRKPVIQKALQIKQQEQESSTIASIAERKEILTDIAKGENEKTAVKAIDVLNKMDALYIQRVKDETDYTGLSEEEMIADVLADSERRAKFIQVFEALGYKVMPIS
jgi:phage terminase small subunit